LKNQAQSLQEEIDNIYNDLQDGSSYRLHSVLVRSAEIVELLVILSVIQQVHDGFAGVGHYWVYVHDHMRDRWLKFNDTSVTEVPWDLTALSFIHL
jgi:hypothetical protein